MTNNINFQILEIDPLGQGVSKDDGQIFFIPKTLPGETGEATVYKSARGVNFCRLKKLAEKSPDRIKPVCPHFNDCPGCHFLHTDYEHELGFKKQALLKIFRKLGELENKIEMIPAKNRLGYRNRMQLHYDKDEEGAFGFFSVALKKIVAVPECLIAIDSVQEKLRDLYDAEEWKKVVRDSKKKQGHVEIYEKDGDITVAVDKDYAEGGFTQVNEAMNTELVRIVCENVAKETETIIDLFGGNGNLTAKLEAKKMYSVDAAQPQTRISEAKFVSLDLFSEKALENFSGQTNLLSTDTLILDPPRSGFRFLKDWVIEFQPKQIIYTSCDPHTMERDIREIADRYAIEKMYLLDLFPSTYHFETVIVLKKK
jgi:23S rRNA (uracil1939-C5)-methyltransferase